MEEEKKDPFGEYHVRISMGKQTTHVLYSENSEGLQSPQRITLEELQERVNPKFHYSNDIFSKEDLRGQSAENINLKSHKELSEEILQEISEEDLIICKMDD